MKQTVELLKHCANAISIPCVTKNNANDILEQEKKIELEQWYTLQRKKYFSTTQKLLSSPMPDWEKVIVNHPAHIHQWYHLITHTINIDNFAVFMLENKYYPAFLPLLYSIKKIQFCEQAKIAVNENIADEYKPEPHYKLMQQLMKAIRLRASPNIHLSLYPSLINRTLIFYYGYFCDPWNLVGSVFATEKMGTYRVTCMDKGLRRLGLNDKDLQFTRIHATCDEHHASDWLERVVIPSATTSNKHRNKKIQLAIAEGIAICLETSNDYLNFLCKRLIQTL